MSKKVKKVSKTESLISALNSRLFSLESVVDKFAAEVRYALAAQREVTSKQADAVQNVSNRFEYILGQVNGGFQNVKSDLKRASDALNQHESEIAKIFIRVQKLETNPERKFKEVK